MGKAFTVTSTYDEEAQTGTIQFQHVHFLHWRPMAALQRICASQIQHTLIDGKQEPFSFVDTQMDLHFFQIQKIKKIEFILGDTNSDKIKEIKKQINNIPDSKRTDTLQSADTK